MKQRSTSRRRLGAITLGAIVIAVAGCGGSDEESSETSTTAAQAAAADPATLEAAKRQYDEFVERNAAALVTGTEEFVAAVDAGDIEEAKRIYTSARAPFERIEPVAGAFGDLDPDIDGREGDIPADDWGGYHRIEKALWIDESVAGLKPITTRAARRRPQPQRHRDQGLLRSRRDRAGLRRPARRGLGVEDHRRGGALLAHRPLGLRGERRGRRGRVQGARARSTRGRPGARRRGRRGVRGDRRGARRLPARRRLRPLLRALDRRHRGPLAADRRARGATLAGRRDSRVSPGLTRRGLLRSAGLAGAGVGLGAGGFLIGREVADEDAEGTGTVEFWGERQAGIVTAAQDRLHFAAFDVTATNRSELRDLMRTWTEAAALMAAGEAVGVRNAEQLLPPEDTGEAFGHLPSRLTITFGFGPSLFDGRFGLSLSARSACASCRGCPSRRSTRRARAATSASRPARTTPRWRSTRSATWPGSVAARSSCAGHSSASGGPRRPLASRTRRAT